MTSEDKDLTRGGLDLKIAPAKESEFWKIKEKIQKLFSKKPNRKQQYKINLFNYLQEFSKKDQVINTSQYKLYRYRADYAFKYGCDNIIYFDAIYNFILFVKNDIAIGPICSIGFDIINNPHPLPLIRQIQGVRGMHKYLLPLRWEKMLIQIIIDWAKKNQFQEVGIIKSKDSRWYEASDKERCKRMYLKYDITAQRMGFKYNKKRKFYILNLKEDK